MNRVSVVTLIRTDTTLDLSQKGREGMKVNDNVAFSMVGTFLAHKLHCNILDDYT